MQTLTIDETRRRNLRALIEQAGGNKAFAVIVQRAPAAVSQWAKGSLRTDTGKPYKIGDSIARWVEQCFKKPEGWMDVVHDEPEVVKLTGISFSVPQYDLRLAAGNGHMQWEVIEGEPYSFPMSVFTRSKVDPANAKIVQVQGDSMSPWVDDGWVVMLDTSPSQRIIDGQPYAIAWDGEYYLKRVTRIPGGALQLTSDNPAYAPVIIPATEAPNVQLLGRVFWRGG